MIRRLLPLAAFILLAALLYAGVRMNSGRDTSAIPSPLIGKAAPAFSLPVFGDPARKVSNRDLLGTPYLLNVWGSWCENCREEHPQITGANANPEKMGAKAAELLLQHADGVDGELVDVILPAQLTVRESSGRVKQNLGNGSRAASTSVRRRD